MQEENDKKNNNNNNNNNKEQQCLYSKNEIQVIEHNAQHQSQLLISV